MPWPSGPPDDPEVYTTPGRSDRESCDVVVCTSSLRMFTPVLKHVHTHSNMCMPARASTHAARDDGGARVERCINDAGRMLIMPPVRQGPDDAATGGSGSAYMHAISVACACHRVRVLRPPCAEAANRDRGSRVEWCITNRECTLYCAFYRECRRARRADRR